MNKDFYKNKSSRICAFIKECLVMKSLGLYYAMIAF